MSKRIEPIQVPISIDAYHLLFEHGMIKEKSELIEGVVYEKMPKDPIHSNVVQKIFKFLIKNFGNLFYIQSENPISIGGSEPEPDISIVPEGDYSKSHPTKAILVIEVANSSLEFDRKKANMYAKAEISEYIIFNLKDKTLEIYKNPKNGIYTEMKIYSEKEKFISTAISELSFQYNQF